MSILNTNRARKINQWSNLIDDNNRFDKQGRLETHHIRRENRGAGYFKEPYR